MSTAERVAEFVDMLPDEEQLFALEFVKRLVLAWDPDFSKVTPSEAIAIKQAEAEFDNGEIVSYSNVNWD